MSLPIPGARFFRFPLIGAATIVGVLFVAFGFVDLRWLALGFVSNEPLAGNGVPAPQKIKQVRPPSGKGPLRVSLTNSRYFADAEGRIVYLTGSHTWANLFDIGHDDPPPVFDYEAFLRFLETNNHNFVRMFVWEQSRWSVEIADSNYWFYPQTPFRRTGPGKALDGKPRFNTDSLDQSYFDRVRRRVQRAGEHGVYVSVMLFNGWSVGSSKGGSRESNPWKGHPLNKANNVNGIDGDLNGNDSGEETQELLNPAVTAVQEWYVRKVVETLNDLDNVLYEISNEGNPGSSRWQYHMIAYVKGLEAKKQKQHPVGMTSEYPDGDNKVLFQSPADWISPNEWGEEGKPGRITRIFKRLMLRGEELEPFKYSPTVTDTRKVIVLDTDHLWGIGGDRAWVWKSFTRGFNPIFMDPYRGRVFGIAPDSLEAQFASLRVNMGYTLSYAAKIDLASMRPSPDLANTTFCLANPAGPSASYLVYRPETSGLIKVDLRGTNGKLRAEWLDPQEGLVYDGLETEGRGVRSFQAPFHGDAVLYLWRE